MSNRPILIAGHSHITAFGIPFKSPDGTPQVVDVDHQSGRFRGLIGKWPREGTRYWDAMIDYSAGSATAIFWRGNQHLAKFLIATPFPFDVAPRDEPDAPLNADVPILPESALREAFAVEFGLLAQNVERLKMVGAVPVLCGTPPPKGDDDFIRKWMAKEPIFVNMAREMGVDLHHVPLVLPRLRVKLWGILQSMMKDLAKKHNILFVSAPPEARGLDGSLKPEYFADDVTHANRSYGNLMLDRMNIEIVNHTA